MLSPLIDSLLCAVKEDYIDAKLIQLMHALLRLFHPSCVELIDGAESSKRCRQALFKLLDRFTKSSSTPDSPLNELAATLLCQFSNAFYTVLSEETRQQLFSALFTLQCQSASPALVKTCQQVVGEWKPLNQQILRREIVECLRQINNNGSSQSAAFDGTAQAKLQALSDATAVETKQQEPLDRLVQLLEFSVRQMRRIENCESLNALYFETLAVLLAINNEKSNNQQSQTRRHFPYLLISLRAFA